MDETFFQKELSKYKVVRKADHYKLRYKKLEKKSSVETKAIAPAPAVEKKVVTAVSGDFWDVLSAGPRCGLTASEWAKFVSAIKLNQQNIMDVLNLEDLEALANNL